MLRIFNVLKKNVINEYFVRNYKSRVAFGDFENIFLNNGCKFVLNEAILKMSLIFFLKFKKSKICKNLEENRQRKDYTNILSHYELSTVQ